MRLISQLPAVAQHQQSAERQRLKDSSVKATSLCIASAQGILSKIFQFEQEQADLNCPGFENIHFSN